MSNVECPYCQKEQEINHNDGYGYEEGVEHEQTCISCNKKFKFSTEMSFDYSVSCQENDHQMEPFGNRWPDMFRCENCDFYEKRTITYE